MSDGNTTPDEHTKEDYNDGRSIRIDTGFYEVQVWGDTSDSFDEVEAKAEAAAELARKDVEEMDENYDNGNGEYHR